MRLRCKLRITMPLAELMVRAFVVVAVVTAVVLALVYVMQRSLIYSRDRPHPDQSFCPVALR
jgi:hypothetical protein